MTGAVCLGAASSIPGSMVNLLVRASQIAKGKTERDAVVIGHASGTMATQGDAEVTSQGEVVVRSGSVYRTARRLMEGTVLYLTKNDPSHIRDI
jgi:2-methylaconitate cis-trans-isomerase PrpF